MIKNLTNLIFLVATLAGCVTDQPISGPNTLRITSDGLIAGGEWEKQYQSLRKQRHFYPREKEEILPRSEVYPRTLDENGDVALTHFISGKSLFDKILGSAFVWASEEASNSQHDKDSNSQAINIPLLVYVHGGLNGAGSAQKRSGFGNTLACIEYRKVSHYYFAHEKEKREKACSEFGIIKNIMYDSSERDRYYPVFVEWDSTFIESYREHALSLVGDRKSQGNIIITGASAISDFTVDTFSTAGNIPKSAIINISNFGNGAKLTLTDGDDSFGRRYNLASENKCLFGIYSLEKLNSELCKNLPVLVDNYNDIFLVNGNSAKINYSASEYMLRGLDFALTPLQLTAGVLFQSTYASRSWDIMKRRVTNLPFPYVDYEQLNYNSVLVEQPLPAEYPLDLSDNAKDVLADLNESQSAPAIFQQKSVPDSLLTRAVFEDGVRNANINSESNGELQIPKGVPLIEFFDYLIRQQALHNSIAEANNGIRINIELTLIGHSMGTIALNNILADVGTQLAENEMIENIVYMAAADSIHNTVNSVPPILAISHKKECSRQEDQAAVRGSDIVCDQFVSDGVKFYNLTLNGVADLNEETFCLFGWHIPCFLPNGSLLVNIDNHYESPFHPVDTTMGRETNVYASMRELHSAFYPYNKNVFYKTFDLVSGMYPAKHGDFGKLPFWRSSTWDPSYVTDEARGINVYKCDQLVIPDGQDSYC